MPTNSMKERTIGCVYLSPLPNQQPGFRFLNLRTGKIITRQKFYEIPITQAVINRVEELAKKDGIKPVLTFQDRKGQVLMADLITGVEIDPLNSLNDENDNT